MEKGKDNKWEDVEVRICGKVIDNILSVPVTVQLTQQEKSAFNEYLSADNDLLEFNHTEAIKNPVENLVIERLEDMGYAFEGKQDFYEFVKRRLTRISLSDAAGYEIRLDFVDDLEPGVLVLGAKVELTFLDDGFTGNWTTTYYKY